MQTVNAHVRLGGDRDNTVPVYGITVSELAVLRLIHGEDGVFDIEPAGEVRVTNREERERLGEKYLPRSTTEGQKSPVDELFPGAAARLFQSLDELELPAHFFKVTERAHVRPLRPSLRGRAPDPKPEPEEEPELDLPGDDEPEPVDEAAQVEAEEDDGVGDMPPVKERRRGGRGGR